MEAETVYYLSSVTRIISTGIKYPTEVALSPAFSDNLDELTANKAIADGYVQILEGKTLSITEGNISLKKEVATNFSIACSLVSAYGVTIGDGALTGMKSYNFSEMFKTKPEQLVQSMGNIITIITANKTGLLAHGITPAFIAKLTGYQTTYSSQKFTTKDAIDVHKDTGKQLDSLLIVMKNMTTTKMDRNAEFFRLDNMDYYLAYKSARKVAHHHIHDKTPIPPDTTTGNLALTIMNKATGEPIENVDFSVLSINYIAVSDVNGEIAKDLLLPGDYTGTLSCTGFAPIDFTFNIKKGEYTELGFMMENV